VKQKAIFLDRDGVINKELGRYVTHLSDFEVLPHVMPNLKKLVSAGFEIVVITNQGGIAKGLYSIHDLNEMHQSLIDKAINNKSPIRQIYFCPHHPDMGYCLCRKPGSLLLEKAIAKFQFDPSKSFMIGDTERDIIAAKAVGVNTFQITSNYDWSEIVNRII
jgi:D-glycero-D-manno-heptose 1,7-bisphosphate phosphatase